MGFEYRLTVVPPIPDLGGACAAVAGVADWTLIATSLRDPPNGIGIQFGDTPDDPAWPHAADLAPEEDGIIYVVCHSGTGRRFLDELIAYLKTTGHEVTVDDDL